jgi:uncharacterized protein
MPNPNCLAQCIWQSNGHDWLGVGHSRRGLGHPGDALEREPFNLKEQDMEVAIASLVLGLIIGYLGQRTRLCYIAGYRDFLMTRDTTLLKGVIGTVVGAVGGFALFNFLGGNVPAFPMLALTSVLTSKSTWLWTIVGGLGVGIVGVLSGGCPFRMHVLACEGKKTYWAYLLGFYAGLIFFNLVTSPWVSIITKSLK